VLEPHPTALQSTFQTASRQFSDGLRIAMSCPAGAPHMSRYTHRHDRPSRDTTDLQEILRKPSTCSWRTSTHS